MRPLIVIISFFVLSTSHAQVSDFKTTNFTMADNIAKLNEGSSLENLPLLAHNLTFKLPTKVEKFRAIYTWVCNNIKGDSNQDSKVTSKRKELKNDSIAYIKWNDKYKRIAFKKLLQRKKTMCTGYAYLIKELCFLANIECKIINGYGRTITTNIDTLELANHSWNAVKLNNKWYLCDATWSSGYITDKNIFIQDYNLGYFLTDPILFAKNHYPLQKKWLLDDSLTNTRFSESPMVYSETFKHKIIPVSPNQMHLTTKKNEEINFSFKSLENISIERISLIQISKINERPFKIYDLKNKNGFTSFKCQFNNKRTYDVHLKIDNDIVATYTIKVTNN